MTEYIDKEKLLQKLSRMIEYCKDDNKVNGLTALFQVSDAIMDCSTADVQEVKHGKWGFIDRHQSRCSECGLIRNIATQVGWDFCPMCGARMDLEEKTNARN